MGDADYPTSTQGEGRCPRCGEGPLKAWYELSEGEREVARRLPAAADFTPEEREVAARLPASADFPAPARMARHRWCTRCWHEESSDTPRNA